MLSELCFFYLVTLTAPAHKIRLYVRTYKVNFGLPGFVKIYICFNKLVKAVALRECCIKVFHVIRFTSDHASFDLKVIAQL